MRQLLEFYDSNGAEMNVLLCRATNLGSGYVEAVLLEVDGEQTSHKRILFPPRSEPRRRAAKRDTARAMKLYACWGTFRTKRGTPLRSCSRSLGRCGLRARGSQDPWLLPDRPALSRAA